MPLDSIKNLIKKLYMAQFKATITGRIMDTKINSYSDREGKKVEEKILYIYQDLHGENARPQILEVSTNKDSLWQKGDDFVADCSVRDWHRENKGGFFISEIV